MKNLTDDELMDKIKAKNMNAFNELFNRYQSLVYGYSLKILGSNREKAFDVSQNVWLKLIEYIQNYKAQGQFKFYLLKMTRNHSLNVIRKERSLYSLDESVSEVPSSQNIESELIQKINIESLNERLQNLNETQRSALLMYVTENLSYEEIAKEMDLSLGAIKTLIFRARQFLIEGHK